MMRKEQHNFRKVISPVPEGVVRPLWSVMIPVYNCAKFLGSNSHKTRSLQDVLEYRNPIEYFANPTSHEIPCIVGTARMYLKSGNTERNRIREIARRREHQVRLVVEVLRGVDVKGQL